MAKASEKGEQASEAERIVDDFVSALEKSLGRQSALAGREEKQLENSQAAKPVTSMRIPEEQPKQDQEECTQNKDFVPLFFSNAPKVKGNFILTEKKKW